MLSLKEILVVLALAVGLLPLRAEAAPRQIVVYPLGDSITYGYSGVAPGHRLAGGYRSPLFTDLAQHKIRCVYVGSSTQNPSPVLTSAHEMQHDGWCGWRIEQIAAHIKKWLATSGPGEHGPAYPNFILLHIATNDIGQHFDPKYPHKNETEAQFMHDLEARMAALVQQIVTLRPKAHLLVAEIIPLGGKPGRVSEVREFNAFVKTKLVPACRAKGERVGTVDQFANFSTAAGKPIWKNLPDECHPNLDGYRLMARTWLKAILKIEKK